MPCARLFDLSALTVAAALMLLPGCADDAEGNPDRETGSDTSEGSTGQPEPGTETSEGSESGTDAETTDTDETDEPTDTEDPPDTEDPTDTEDTDTGELPPGCGQPNPGPGTIDLSVDVDGVQRNYQLFIPVTYDPQNPSPLVLNFHGLLGNPGQQADLSQFNQSATLRGMVVAYPEGVANSFNAGACCGDAHADGVDDLGFARALVEQVVADLCIDPKRVYAAGMSNGGHMAHMLACEAADMFASVASVTGVLGLDPSDCSPSRPISVLDFHGTDDFIVQYGGAGPGYPAVVDMMEGWAARNGCSPVSEVSFMEGDTTCETWPGCDAGVEVTLCTVEGGGHCWFGNPSCLFGSSTTAIDASETLADMFLLQPLP